MLKTIHSYGYLKSNNHETGACPKTIREVRRNRHRITFAVFATAKRNEQVTRACMRSDSGYVPTFELR